MQQHKGRLVLAAGVARLGRVGVARAHGEADHAPPAAAVRKAQTNWGIAGDSVATRRSIDGGLRDTMRFTPGRLDVRPGETLRFRMRHTGRLMHEFVIGTQQANKAHAALMAWFPGWEPDAPHRAPVAPGKSGPIVWTFNRAGRFEFARLIAGHHQVGMVGMVGVIGVIDVTASAAR